MLVQIELLHILGKVQLFTVSMSTNSWLLPLIQLFCRDNNMLVQSELFSALGKVQPFTVSMSTNSQLLLDFHCHLTTSEVVGYLGGKWDYTTQHLSIQQAFPCRCRLGDGGNAPLVEEEVAFANK